MSRALSARCLHRSVLVHIPQPSQCAPRYPSGGRRYSLAALKTRPQSDRERPERQEPPHSYARADPYKPDIRIQPGGHVRAQVLRERRPPPREAGETEEDALRARAADVGEAAETRGEGSSGAPLDVDEPAPTGRARGQSTRRGRSCSAFAPRRPAKHDEVFSDHLNGLFAPLKFPLDLSARILTQASHPAAFHGHNAQFAFIGRRVVESYLLLLLTSSPRLKPSHDLQDIVSRVLNTYFLGEHIGSKWGLGRVMRWTPTIAASMLAEESRVDKTKLLKDVGLYKVQGDAVTAVVGGIFQQFGGSVAHRVFHTRILPRLLLPQGGLPACFHADASGACARLGGADGDLLVEGSPRVSDTAIRGANARARAKAGNLAIYH